ncbi:carboxypeptidase-like regulatory domain-containing protein [Carboxylicivirga sp. N1Y90]|uniref:carboxypeptidase-like regulatory domain-containing protein n=1 Tax=Carboxylicivirga fragile TaxID=3417571 RepID=UPI003D32D054|nr:hypothetical protein [Marinilabiliaceae bacterium N1Y90]
MNSRIKHILIIGLLFNCIWAYTQTREISGRIWNSEENLPIKYAAILDISENKAGTTTNASRNFSITINENIVSLYISALGFRDTIVTIGNNSYVSISLCKKRYELGEVKVHGSKLDKYHIGSKSLPIKTKNDNKIGFPFKNAGFSHGLYVRGNKKTRNSLVKSISFFVADIGPLGGEFLVHFLKPMEKMSPNKYIFSKNLKYFSTSQIVIKANKRGWNTFNVLDNDIVLPEQDFLMILTPIEMGPSYVWNDKNGEWYSSVFAVYDKKRMQNIKWIVKEYNKLCYIDVKGVDNYIPAFVIEVLK